MEKKISKNQKTVLAVAKITQKRHNGGFLALLLLVLGFGDPTKGMTRIWGHFVILVGCELVTFKPQIMLKCEHIFYKCKCTT